MDDTVTQGEDVSVEQNATVETDTTDVSSNEEQTAEDSGGEDSASSTKDTGSNFVPYERFREVNEKAKRAEELEARVRELEQRSQQPKQVDPQTEQIKEQLDPILKDLGYVSRQELQQMEEDKAIQGELSRLENRYDGSDGRPKFDRNEVVRFALERQIGDIETAYEKLHQKELINWHIKQAQTKSKGIKTETSDGSGSAESGTTNEDLKTGIARGDNSAKELYLKRLAKQLIGQ